jgi:hypothetical protein
MDEVVSTTETHTTARSNLTITAFANWARMYGPVYVVVIPIKHEHNYDHDAGTDTSTPIVIW